MDIYEALVLGLVQGLTEFLPISSSGHLRISVSSDSARVDYVRAYLPKDETSRRKNGEISTSYLLK